jgi:hypothetical protein
MPCDNEQCREERKFLQEALDDALEIMLKIRIKVLGIKKKIENHKFKIKHNCKTKKQRQQIDEEIWDIIEYDELFGDIDG